MTQYFGTHDYLFVYWGLSAFFLLILALINRKNVRVGGVVSWLVFLIFGSAAGFLAMPIVEITGLNEYIVPLAATALFLSLIWIHVVMPSLSPDFQTEGLGSSLTLAFAVALAAAIAGYTSELTTLWVPDSTMSGPMPTE